MKKKWLAIGLSLALAAGTVTGCAGSSQEGDGNQGSDSSGTGEVTTLRIALKGISMEDERQKTWFDKKFCEFNLELNGKMKKLQC